MSLEKALRGFVIAGIFAIPFIPLIVAQSMFFPFITGKNFAFRVIVELISALWLALALVNPAHRPRRSWILYAITAFVLTMAVADAFAVYPFKAFWSNYERMEGWVTLAHLWMLFVVAASVLNTEKMWRWFWHINIFVSVLIGFFGIFQLMGWLTINQGGVRIDATFGNAIYLAFYMTFLLFMTALMWQETWRVNGRRVGIGVLYGIIMALQAFTLFFTASRGSLIGTVGGALLSAFLLVVLANGSKNAWRASIGVVAALVILVGGFFAARNTAFVQSIEPLQRLASISLSDTTTIARFYNAGMAIKGIQERPLLGWGQEGYNFVFNKFYDPRMYGQEQWFDRTHNIIFDWLVAGGLIGFLAYMSIYLAAMWALWKSKAFTVAEYSIFTGLIAAYFFSLLFVFDNITSYTMFCFVLAYIAARSSEAQGKPRVFESASLPRASLWALAPAGLLLGVVVVWVANWNAYQANLTLIHALQQQSADQGGIEQNITLFKQALSYHSYGDQEIREQLVQGAAGAAGNSIPAAQKQELFTLASDEMKKQEQESPQDARFPFFLGILYGAYGQAQTSVKELQQALSLSPTKQTIKFQLAYMLTQTSDVNGALDLLKSAHEEAPQFDEPRIMYAAMLVNTNQDALADQIIRPLLDKGTGADQRLISAYAAQKRYDKVAELWAFKAKANPQDPQARFALAASYYAGGDKQKAIETLTQAAQDIPTVAPQATQLIDQIKAGTIKVQ